MGFFSREAGQKRREWLDGVNAQIGEVARYYLGPGFSDAGADVVNVLGYMNPVNDIGEAMAAGRDGEYLNMLTHTATAAAPLVAGKVAKAYNPRMADDAAQWLEDTLMGVSVNPMSASLKAAPGRFVADESGNVPLAAGKLTPAQQQAQDVLDLFKAGRADEVTDEMLAAADDMYLFDHYDLPMDEASRMARAKEMGFDTGTPLYHGTDAEFDRFESRRFGQNDQGWYGRGVTTDTDPEVAEGYANYNEPDSGQQILSLHSRGKFLNWPEDVQPYATRRDAISGTRDVQALGYDGTRYTNDRDLYGGEEEWGTEQVTFNPANIRSRFARFDPRLKHLANLSAAGAGVAYLGGMTPEEQRKAEIRAYLGE